MAQYITRPGNYDLSLAGPFRNRSANMQMHVLNGQAAPLRKTLNHYLNSVVPWGSWYIPLGDRIVLSCVDIQEGRAGDEDLGSMHEAEVAIFIPALFCNPLPRRIVCFATYLFVNNVWATVMGREVHGFRKDIATSFASHVDVDGPHWNHEARGLEHVEAWAMRRPGKGSRLERMRLVEIRPHEDRTALSHDASGLIPALIGCGPTDLPDGLRSELTRSGVDVSRLDKTAAELLADLVIRNTMRLRMVFLRQFRDPRQSQMADVQEVIEAEAVAELKGAPSILRPGSVLFHEAVSHPIACEHGLRNDQWIRADLSLELNLDFVVNDVTE